MNKALSLYPENWNDFKALAAHRAKQGAWTPVDRSNFDHDPLRDQRQSFHDKVAGIYYVTDYRQKLLSKRLFSRAPEQAKKENETFFADMRQAIMKEVNCYRYASDIGISVPENYAVAINEKCDADHLWGVNHLSVQWVLSLQEEKGLQLNEILQDLSNAETKRKAVATEGLLQLTVAGIVHGDRDRNMANMIVSDFEQEEPKKLRQFDFEYAGRSSIAAVINVKEKEFDVYHMLAWVDRRAFWDECGHRLRGLERKLREGKDEIAPSDRQNMLDNIEKAYAYPLAYLAQ